MQIIQRKNREKIAKIQRKYEDNSQKLYRKKIEKRLRNTVKGDIKTTGNVEKQRKDREMVQTRYKNDSEKIAKDRGKREKYREKKEKR